MSIQNKPRILRSDIKAYTDSGKNSTNNLVAREEKKNLSYPFLAGLIDGDGFLRSYKNTSEVTITFHEIDKPFANQLQAQLGGDVRTVPNKKAVRLFLNSKNAISGKQTLLELTQGLNGHIRNSTRVLQFKEMCLAFQVEYLTPTVLDPSSGYIAGLFCSDGSIFMNCRPSAAEKSKKIKLSGQKSNDETALETTSKIDSPAAIEARVQRILNGVAPLIEVRIVSKMLADIGDISLSLGYGKTYFSKGNSRAPNGTHCFYIKNQKDILGFLRYMNHNRSDSIKHARLDLITEFFELKKKKAHLQKVGEPLNAAWVGLVRKWLG